MDQTKTKTGVKLYTEKQASVCALLTGPIAPGLLIYLNYKALGRDKEAYITLALTLIFAILLFFFLFQLPDEVLDKIPNLVFTAIYGVLVYILYHYFLQKIVDDALEKGATKGSNWTVAGISLIALVINIAIILTLSSVDPFYEGEVLKSKGNELYYDSNIDLSDAQSLQRLFEIQDFFGPDYGNVARMQLLEEKYLITMVVDEKFWTDTGFMNYISNIESIMQLEFETPLELRLESFSLTGKSKFKYISD